MSRLEDDNEYQKTIKVLKNLRKIGAPSNFEIELLRKINAGSQRKEKKSWFDMIFSPMLIPTTALTFTTMIIFLSAMIIFLLLRPQVDETGKNLKVSPQLFEEKIDKQTESKPETKQEKISSPDIKMTDRRSLEGASENQKKNNVSPIEAASPNETSNANQPAQFDNVEVETATDRSEQKTNAVGGQDLQMLQTKEGERKQLEMLKGKIDTTKDSSKNSRKLKKF